MPKGVKGFQKGKVNPSKTAEARERSRHQMIALTENPKYKEIAKRSTERFWKSARGDELRQKRREYAKFADHKPHETNLASGGYRNKNQKLVTIKKRAWDLWSKYRRSREADFAGYVKCYTCERSHHWKETDLGHYKHRKLDFDEMNTNIQCTHCNRFRHGNLDIYTMKLIKQYGIEAVEDLHRRAAQFDGYTREEYYEIIERYAKYGKTS